MEVPVVPEAPGVVDVLPGVVAVPLGVVDVLPGVVAVPAGGVAVPGLVPVPEGDVWVPVVPAEPGPVVALGAPEFDVPPVVDPMVPVFVWFWFGLELCEFTVPDPAACPGPPAACPEPPAAEPAPPAACARASVPLRSKPAIGIRVFFMNSFPFVLKCVASC